MQTVVLGFAASFGTLGPARWFIFQRHMTMQLHGERLHLGLWIMSLVIVAATGLGFFHKAIALSQIDTAADGTPVVLELFTSEGCSSCPPADALLSELGSSTNSVIPLAYHVDYWNHLGWSDPFSSHEWSERQSAYARVMNLNSDYTPQMVIGGNWQCVGSDGRSIARSVALARSVSAVGRVSLQTKLKAAGPRPLQVKVDAQILHTAQTGRLIVMLAIYENGLVSKIGGGENGGRRLTYDYTVRRLLPAFELKPLQGASGAKELNIALDPSWSVDHLGVVAFIQDAQHRLESRVLRRNIRS